MNRLKKSCICHKDDEYTNVCCPYHGQDALNEKLGFYCTSCGGSGYVQVVESLRKNAKKAIRICPFCRE